MRKFWSTLAIVLILLPFAGASAESFSISQEIHLQGVVPDMRYIVVNSHGSIIEITSNTLKNITPEVRLNSLGYGPEVPLTPAIQKEYEAKTNGIDMQSVDLHFTPPTTPAVKNSKSNLLNAIGNISLLRLMHS